jgi:hypothetical protein
MRGERGFRSFVPMGVYSDWVLPRIVNVALGTKVMASERRKALAGVKGNFLEHGLADEPGVQRWQARLNGLNGLVLGGCTLNRDIERLVRQAGFTFDRIEKYYVEGDPKVMGWVTRAVARASASWRMAVHAYLKNEVGRDAHAVAGRGARADVVVAAVRARVGL